MNTEKNIRKGFGLAGKIAMFYIGLASFILTSCESELKIQQSYPFTVETMPVPKELNRNETAEIRCKLKRRAILKKRSYDPLFSVLLGRFPETGQRS